MHKPGRSYGKWHKPDRERQILHGITSMWHLKKKSQTQKQSGCQGKGEVGKGCKCSIIRWIWSEDLIYNMVSIVDNSVMYN